MRIALIGVSHWHMPLLLEPLLKEEGIEIVGVCDPNRDVAGRYAERLGCSAYHAYSDLCVEQRPDFAFALAPHRDMPATASFLMDEGIPFVIEKPAGISANDIAPLVARAAATGHFVAIPFVFRYSGFLQALKEHAAGETVHYAGFRFIAGPPSRYVEAGCGWMLDQAQSGGGSGINLGVHFLDLCRLFWPDAPPVVKSALVSNSASGAGVEDHSLIALKGGDRTCLVETGYMYPAPVGIFDMHFSLRTERHYFAVRGPGEIEISDMSGHRRTIAATTTNMPHYPTFVADTLARFKAGRPPIADLGDLEGVMRLVDSAYQISGRVSAAG